MADSYRELIQEGGGENAVGEKSVAQNAGLEQEILDLENQLAQKRAALAPEQKETIEQQVVGAEKMSVAPQLRGAAPQSVGDNGNNAVVVQTAQELKSYEKNQQLKMLVDLAFTKGVSHAADVVRHLDSPYLMDEFHDTLIDKLYKELVERGKLEEI